MAKKTKKPFKTGKMCTVFMSERQFATFWRGKNLGHSDLDRFTRTKVQS